MLNKEDKNIYLYHKYKSIRLRELENYNKQIESDNNTIIGAIVIGIVVLICIGVIAGVM